MHIKRNALVLRGGLIIIGLLVLAGCNRGTQGIFATIEVEEKTATSNLVDNTSIGGLVKTQISAEQYVVLAGTKVFTRTTAGSNWGEIGSPSGLNAIALGGIDTNADEVAEEVYAAFFDSGADRYYIYSLTAVSGGGLRWDRVTDTSAWNPATGDQITGMAGVGDYLLVSVTDVSVDGDAANSKVLYRYGSGLGAPDVVGNFRDSLRDAARFGTAVVIVGRNTLAAHTSDIDNTNFTGFTDIPNASGVGVIPSSAPPGVDLFGVTTLSGNVYTSPDGLTWTIAEGSLDRSFSDLTWVEEQGGFLVVGSKTDEIQNTTRRGYYEVTISGAGPAYSLSYTNDIGDNYTGSELAISAIERFQYYPDGTLFALTAGKGLWRTVYPATGEPRWTWE